MTPPAGLHQATYTATLLPAMAGMLGPITGAILDPFGGLGHKFAALAAMVGAEPHAVELEPGYLAHAHRCVIAGDATALPFAAESFSAAVTSPVYPNGMADNFHAKDASVRHTYVHGLRRHYGPGYALHPNNAAGTNPRRSPAAMARFYAINAAAYAEVFRVLTPGAPFVVNTKDTPAEPFTARTRDQLHAAGFVLEATAAVFAPGLNHGKGAAAKATHEDLTMARKPAE
jgi:hypothetical protein